MRIYYHLSHYVSHREAGLEYIRCLTSLGHEVETVPARLPECSVVILHDDPLALSEVRAALPNFGDRRIIAYCVWEGDRLPEMYRRKLEPYREIWTCSNWSRESFLELPGRVDVLPHVVRRVPFSPDDLAFARRVTGADDGHFLLFSIVDGINPRKNLAGLLGAFQAARAMCRKPLRLVLKQYRVEIPLSGLPGVYSLYGDFTRERMAALHAVTQAYVSAHHAEGWGLGISTSMAYGKPVAATGWSGNMEYMDDACSLPVPYTPISVSAEMCRRLPLFTPDMTWAEPDIPSLATLMCRMAEGRIPGDLPEKAAAITSRFGPRAIAERLQELLDNPA